MSATKKFATAALTGLLSATVMTASAAHAGTNADRISASEEAGEKNACKGHNECKGKGGCSSSDNGCAGKNSCKGKGGCKTGSGE
jgi:hypothetical protein